MNRYIFFALLGALLSSGCYNEDFGGTGPAEGSSADRSALTVTRLTSGDMPLTLNSGITDSTRVVIRTQTEWSEIWQRIWNRHSPLPPLPQVDFSQEMVVVVGLGTRSSGGYAILVDSVFQRTGQIEVVVQKHAPGANCVVTAALTQPVDAVRVHRSADPVRFTERSNIRSC